MRTNVGATPYTIESQSVIEIMYRTWFFILSVGILLPLRWLPNVLPKPSKMTLPVLATAAMISCGELVLANPTISPPGPHCPGSMVTISFTGTNLPDGEVIEVFLEDNSTYDPFNDPLTSIGSIPIDYSCTTCPTIMAVMLNPATCSGLYSNDDQNEFMVMGSGCGFNVSNFQLNPSVGGAGVNDSIGGSQACQWSLANATAAANFLISNGTGCTGNIFPAGPSTQIPGGAIVITFSDAFGPNVPFNFQSLCATGMPIYILSSSCDRVFGAYSNTAASSPGYTLTECSPPTSQFSYNTPPAPANIGINNIVALGGASFVSTPNCTDPGLSSLNFPDIPVATATLNYTIPAGICGSGTGLVDFYISGMIDLAGPCEDLVATPPSGAPISIACPVTILPVGPLCSNGIPVQLMVSGSVGPPGVWSGGPYISPSGLFDPSLASPGNNMVTYNEASCTASAIIVVNEAPEITYNPIDFNISSNPCDAAASGNVTLYPTILGNGPFTIDWESADNPPLINPTEFEFGVANLATGNYYYIATDVNGCADTLSFYVPTAAPVSYTSSLGTIACFGGTAAGGITLIGINDGNDPPGFYTYDWNLNGGPNEDFGGDPDPTLDPEDISPLVAGTYYLTITVNDGNMPPEYECYFLDTFIITEPPQLIVTPVDGQVLCFGDNTGTVSVNATGGTGAYTYNWTNISGTDTQTETGLPAGGYYIIVTDANGCPSAVDTAFITQPAAPLIAMATGETIDCDDNTGDIDLTVTGGTIPYTFDWDNDGTGDNDDPEDLSGLNSGTYSVTVTDDNGCTAVASATIDLNPPTFMLPPDDGSTVPCISNAQVQPIPPPVVNSCGDPLTITLPPIEGPDPACEGDKTYTFTYTDPATGNSDTWVYTYTVDYSAGLTAPMNGSLTISCPALGVDPGAPANILDACGLSISAVFVSVVSTPNPITCDGSIVYTYRYTACDGSTVDWTFTYTIDFSTGLTAPPAGSMTVACPVAAVNPGAPANITDACGNVLVPALVGSLSTPDPITCDGMVVWTYRYTACDGSTVDWLFTYTVDYSGALMPPSNGSSTVTCPAAAVAPTAPANILDACGNTIIPTLVGSTSNPNPIICDGTVIWTYRYTACDGSFADWTYTYTVDYSGAPMPPSNGSSTVTCPAAAVNPGPPANILDACGNTIIPTLVGSVSNPNPIICDGTVVWTYRYTACDNSTADWTYTYTIDYSGALIPPANGSMTVSCPSAAVNPGAPANITDACGRIITPVLIGSVINPNPITCDGSVVWTYRYTACDNSFVDWTYTYTVDYSGVLVAPANGSANISCAGDAVNPGPPASITDACGRVLTPVLVGSVSNPDPIVCDGTVIWTYRYTACDNSTVDWTFTYTVSFSTGLTAPPPGSMTVSCPAAAVNPGPPANITDACGTTLMPVLIGSVSTPDPITCDGSVVWTYQYTACDNSTVDWTFTYTVDYSGTLMPPSNGSSTVTCPVSAVNPGAPANILDACGNTIVPTLVGSTSNPNPIICDGTVIWTYRYTACDGSTADWTYTYTVDYSGTLMPPSNGSSMVTCPAAAVNPGPPANILDACGNTLVPALIGSVSNPNPITCDGTVVWTYRYTACDNTTADWTYTYTVDYSGALVPPANGSMTVACPADAADPGAPANITDACGRVITPVLIGSVINPNPITCDGSVVWTYRYTACDNSFVDWTYTYTVDYSGMLVPPANGSANISCAGDAVNPGAPASITDACGRVLTPVLVGSVSNPDPIVCDGTVIWTYRYTACDNSTVDWTFTYTISFSTGLMAPPAGSMTITCPAAAVNPGAPANIMDACGNTLVPVLIGSVSTPDPITCDGMVVWTYQYTACDGSTVDWTYTYTVDYSGTLMPPSNGTSMITCPADAVDPGAPANILDACGNTIVPVLIGSVSNPNPITCDGTVVWTYRYTACDNSTADWTYTYTVDYSGTLTPPANGSSMVTCPGDAVDPGPPANILDACGNTLMPMLIGSVSNPNPITCDGTVVWTYRYTACDNTTADWTFTYTVDYSGTLVPPANGSMTVACPADAANPGAPANITDACGNTIIPVLVGSVSSPDPITCDGTVVWTYQYTACDNSTVDWTYTYTVDYSGALVPPPNGTANISCAGDAVDPGSPGTITDACGRIVSPVLIGSVSNPDPIVCDGTIIWTYQYTACDNSTVDWTFTYTISFSTGLMAPPAGSMTVACPADAVDPGAPADIMDACGNTLTPVLIGSVSNPDPITCDGSIVWTYRYTACDNSTVDWTFTYTIDYSGALVPPANGTAMVTCPDDAVDPGAPSNILDACGNTIVPVLVGSTSNPNPIICDGTIVWTYQYEACDGSTVDWTFTYTVDYSGALVPPGNGSSTVACPGDAVDPGAPADILDACGNSISPVLIGSVSNPNPITCDGTIVWTYQYTACDNSTVDWTYTYTVDYAGSLTAPAAGSSTVSCLADAVDPGPPADITDACGRILTAVLMGSVSNPDPIICDGTVVWTYQYTACDNSTVDWTYTYTINFSTGLVAPPTGSMTVACPADAVDPGAPADIMDACGNTLVPVLIGSISTPDPITCDGTVVWTYQYTACDNSTVDWTYTYTVDYSGALVPPANGSSTVMCAADAVDPGAPSSILDACGNTLTPVLVGSVINPDPIICDGTVVWTYRYTACDNSTADWTYTYTIENNGSLIPPANGSSTVACPADAVDPGAPADIIDACGNSISPVLIGSVSNPNPITCDGTIVWTYQYTACDLSTVDWTYTYTVDYSGTLTAPPGGSSTVSCLADAVDPGPPADITDACGRILTPVLIGSVSNPDPIICDGTVVWTYQYTACDNSTVDWTYTYTINFSTGLTAPPAGSLTVDCPADAVDPGAPASIMDACGNILVPVLIGSVSTPDPITCDGTVVWTYQYTACDNSTVDWTFTYTVDYSGTLTLPGNGSSTITCAADAVDPGPPANVTDACGTILIPVLVGSVSNPDPITCDGTVVWTYRYTACDNSTADWTYTYTVDYSGALVPPANGSSTITCAVDAVDPGAPANILDACGNTIIPVLIGSVSNPDPITCDGTVIWTYRYTACDNSTIDWTYTYTINFSTGLTAPPSGSLTVDCPADAVDPGAPANILDACGNTIIPVLMGSSSNPNPIICDGTVLWTYQYTACDGSTVDWTFTYTVDYNSILTPPANGSLIVSCVADAVDPGAPATITDACGNMISPVLVGSVSNPDPITCDGTVVWTYRYTACDNSTVDWTFTYTITFSTGLTPPANGSSTVSCPADAVDPGAPANIIDACGNTLIPVLIGSVSAPDPILCDGSVVWTYRYTACDNSTVDWTYTYTVDYSGTLTPPANGSSTITCAADAVDPGAPADIMDACGNPLTAVLVGSTSTPDPITCDGSVVWTYRYTACDNSTTDWTYTYTVDYSGTLVPPAIGSSTVTCSADAVNPGAPADIIDACGNTLTPVLVGSVSTPDPITCDGSVVWTYRYTACDNSTADWTFTYTVDYSGALVPPANGSSTITCSDDAVDPGPPADIVDACGNILSPVLIGSVSNPNPIVCSGTIVWTYRYTACDNSTVDWTFTYNIDDDIPPTASNPAPISVDCAGAIPVPDINAVTDEADNCPATLIVAFVNDASDGGSCPEIVTRTYSVTDACGNQIFVTQSITVGDVIPPTASDPAPVTVECIGDVPTPDENVVTDEADNCGGTITVAFVSDVSGGGPCPEIITRTYSVTDECGNSILVTQLITIDDDTPPTASSPAPITVDCIADVPAADINVIDDEADNCPAAIVVAFVGDVSDGASCPETITRTYSVTDACGNETLVTQSIIVDDDVLPTASNPSTLTAVCIGDVPAPDISVVTDAADNCPGTITVAFVGDASDGASCPETITRTYSVTDACGNEILVAQSIIVDDDVPPTASNPAAISVDCAGSIPVADINVVTDEADNCPEPVVVAFVSDASDGGSCPETVTRTYSVTDACGNEIFVTQSIVVGDIIPPTASDPAPVTVECIGDVPTPDENVVTDEADNCGGTITVAFVSDVSGGGPCPEIITRTYSVTDECGNSILVTQQITIDDDTPPTASSPAPITVDCIADVPAADINVIDDEADNCPAAIVVAFVGDVSDGASCPETITRTYSVTDACGNETLVTQSIIVDDDILPTASNPSTLTATCIGDVPAPDISVVTDAADNCPGTITVAFIGDASDGASCPETITRTYSVTDACGNEILVTQSIIVDDDVPPTASNPAPISVDCAGSIPVPDINVVTDEADNCPEPVVVAFVSDASDGGSCPEIVTRTYSVTDACGNQILVTQSITVGDVIPPTASDPAPVTVECIGDVPTPDENVVTDEADNCGGILTVAFVSDVSGGGPCPEIITRTYSVTDECGNSILVTQQITIDDDTPPTASSPAPITVDCIADVPAADINVIDDEADNCPAAIVVAFVGDVSDGASCPETITRTYSVTDACGNETLVTQSIIVDDDILPTASNPSTLTAVCIGDVPAPDISVVTDAADNCPGTITVAFVGDVSDGGSCPETITRTYSVTDACGNEILVTQSIIVDDDVPPTASNPAPIAVDCAGAIPVPDINEVTDEADNCLAPVVVAFVSDVSDGGSCPESVTRTYSVTDACGNEILVTQTITVGDIIPPTASDPAPVTVGCIGDVLAPDVNDVTDEADNCGGAITVAFVSDVSGGGPCPEIITRTYSVTDDCGNSILVTQLITVDDDTPPTASSPAPITVDCIADVPAPDINLITDEADNCPAAIVVAFVGDVSDGASCPETITRTYSATDACGNVTLVTQSIVVDDDILPTASNPSTLTATCIGDVPAPDISVVTDAADNCPGTITVAFVGDASDGGSCPETITRTYSVTDACGNEILVTQSIIVNDDVPPTASNPAPLAVDCAGSIPVPDINVVTDEADNCAASIIVAFVSDASDGGTCPETVTRTYSVTDECGNQILVTQSITVGDIIPPTASDPAPVTVECVGDIPAPDVNDVTDEADNCAGLLTVAFISDVSGGGPCPEIITRTYSVTDDCGNSIIVTQLITVDDDTPPTASNPAPVTVACIGDVPPADISVITDAADNCPAPVVVAFVSDVPDGASCPLTITRTYSLTDGCGNQTFVTQLISVEDDVLPTATNPSSIIVSGCNMPVPAPDLSVVTDAADNCSIPVVAFVSDVTDLVGCTETTTRTFSVTDACNNSITVEQLIIRTVDLTPPVFVNPPADLTVDCIAQAPPLVSLDYTDNCSPGGTVTGTETGPSGNPLTIVQEWTATDDCGNTTTLTVTITVGNTNLDINITENICPGESVTINGEIYDTPGMYLDTLPGMAGECDTTVNIEIILDPLILNSISASYCFGDSVLLNGIWYSSPNTYFDTIPSTTGGCDTALTITITEDPLITSTVSASYCFGDSVLLNGIWYSSPNTYFDTIPSTTGGCDTALTITITEDPLINSAISASYCAGDSVLLNGIWYDSPNTYLDTIPSTTGGCDTALTITITEDPLLISTIAASYCVGDSVLVNGIWYDSPNTYLDTIPSTTGGCDTAVTITITEEDLILHSLSVSFCTGSSVFVYGIEYNVPGFFIDTVMSTTGGCDTAVIIAVSEEGLLLNTVNESYCEGGSVFVYGTEYDMPGTYFDTIPSTTGGCDTAVTINITEDLSPTKEVDDSFCTGSSVFVYGVEYDMPGTYEVTVMSTTGGCDTLVTINITEQNLIPDAFDYTGCEGDGFSIIINGTEYDEMNPTGTEIIPGQAGACDTILTVTLVFAPNTPAEIMPAGPLCTEAGVYTLMASTSDGTWSGSVTSDQFDPAALGTGIHQVIYTTPAGPCQSADTIDIEVYELTIACQTIQDETATGAGDGIGQVTISGGMPPYDIDWSGSVSGSGSGTLPADGDFQMNDLAPGVYTVTVTDATGCSATCQFTIDSPIPCDLTITDVFVQDASCPGVDNGVIIITAAGNMPPFEYSLDDITYVSTNQFDLLAPGAHIVYVRDAAGCVVSQNVNVGVGQGPDLTVDEMENASCGECNGSLIVQVTGGITPYNYSIDGIMYGGSPNFPGLCAGNYLIYLIDDVGCTDTIPVTIGETDAPIINNVNIQNSSCGQSDGSLTINATGGLGDLMYSIGGAFQSSNFFDGLPAGVYNIVVEDESGCQITSTATITDIGAPVINNIMTTPTSCGTFDGTATIIATGTPPLMYSLDGGTSFQDDPLFENLPAGTYTAVVRDGNGCLVSMTVVIITTDGPVITDVNVTNTSCGEENGIIEIIASGGTGDLTYILNGDSYDDENEIPDLPAGVYEIEVWDENNCSASTEVTILPSEGPDFDVYITPAHCGLADGCIELDGFDGQAPYTYSMTGLPPFSPVFVFCNKVSDFYTVAIMDANGCIHEEEVFLWEEEAPEITSIIVTNPACGETTGTIEVMAEGSDPLTYSKQLPVFQSSNIFTDVLPGTYTITVRDEAGCTTTATAVVVANPSPILSLTVVDTECGLATGSITASATGGIAPYEYKLNNDPFGPANVFTGLAAGPYTVIVRGANGCTDTLSVTIISVGTQFGAVDDSFCAGSDYVFEGNIFTMPGDYDVPIPGGAVNGCDSIVTLTLTELPLIESEFTETICANEVYTYDGIDYNTAGTYVLDTITAVTGCDTILIVDLIVNPLETTYIDTFICTGGVFTINGMDYTMTGEYLIDTVQAAIGCDSARILRLTVNDFNEITITEEICSGETYTINGMDYTTTGLFTIDTLSGPGGCDTVRFLDLTVNPLPTANAGADLALDCDVLTVTLSGSAVGGSPLWTGPDINAGNENQLMPEVSLPGTYILTVTSPENCISIDSVVVTLDPETVIANAGVDDSLSCDVLEITLQASPVGPEYSYLWTGPGINSTNETLPNPTITEQGLYTLVVTNTVTGCVSAPDDVVISDISAILIAIIQDPISFNCYIDSVNLEYVGSSTGPNIVYAWLDEDGNLISTSPVLEITSGGAYVLIVQDTISGCFDNDTVEVLDLTQYPTVDAGLPQAIDCNNPTVILNEGATNNNDLVVFQWTGPQGGIIGPDTLITAVAGIPGQYYYLMAMDTSNGCQNVDSVFVSDLTELPIADIDIAETITCIDETALLTIGSSSTGSDLMYVWSGPDLSNVVSETLETTVPGQYYLDVINEATGCSSSDTAEIDVPSEPQDLTATIEIPVCAGDDSGSITVTDVTGGTPDYMYSLDGGPPQSSPIFEDLFAGDYSIMVIDANGCTYGESVNIAEGLELTIDIGPDIDLELGDSITLWADVSLPWSQIDSIVWTPLDILSCSHCTNPVLYGLHTDVVTATVYAGGCIDEDMLTVRVDVDANIYIPNVFSPNDDGVNDYVTVFTDHRVETVVFLEIFDRWGNLVFRNEFFDPNDPSLGWDGTFKGEKMNPAVFAYSARVELINGDQVSRKGDITIIR